MSGRSKARIRFTIVGTWREQSILRCLCGARFLATPVIHCPSCKLQGEFDALFRRRRRSPAGTRAARRVHERSGGRCEVRKTCKGAFATELHHRLPRMLGGRERVDNLVDVCRHCHRVIHSKTEKWVNWARENGWLVDPVAMEA